MLFLFDIDGTLLSPGPSARKAISQAIENYTGFAPDLQIKDVAGLTDRLIIKIALQKQGANGDLSRTIDRILNDYLSVFENSFLESNEAFVYDDAIKLVVKIVHKGYPCGLLTGNVQRGAQIKLGRFDLMRYFSFGAFGDDGETRNDLPIIARSRAQESLGESYQFNEIVLIGDTPEDAYAAKINGCHAVVVCRRPEWYAEIKSAGADLIVDSLDDSKIVEQFLTNF